MNTNIKPSRPFFVFCFVVFSVAFAYGQENKLIYSREVSNVAEKVKGILQKSTAYVSVDFVTIDLEKVKNQGLFTLQFGERTIRVSKEQVISRSSSSYTFVGSNGSGDHVSLTVLRNDIRGIIATINGVFSVMTIGNKEYAIVQVDQSKLKEGCERLQFTGTLNANYGKNSNIELEGIDEIKSSTQEATRAYSCKVRVLVVYTPAARSFESDIENMVLNVMNITSGSLNYSGINYQIELAYAGLIDYIEDEYIKDLERIQNTADGYMDGIHELRNKCSADLVVLLIYNPADECGVAYFYVNDIYAFCVVNVASGCADANYSFAHDWV